MKKLFFLCAILFCTTALFSQSLTNEQQQIYEKIKGLIQKRTDAALKNDHVGYQEVQDTGSVIVRYGKKHPKNEFHKLIQDKQVSWESITIDQTEPHFYDDNKICIILGKATIKMTKPSKVDKNIHFTDVFVNKDGHWKSIYFSNTEAKN